MFCEIFSLLLSYVVPVISKVKISQNFVAFSEYMNFIDNFFLKIYLLQGIKKNKKEIKISFFESFDFWLKH